MITINTDSLKEFQRRTASIQRNTTLPALAFLKLEFTNGKHYITKTNARCTVVALLKTVPDPTENPTLMLDERILFSFLNLTKSAAIGITHDQEKVYIDDGKTKVDFQREDPTNFPKTPNYSAAQSVYTFNKEHLTAINIGRNYILDSETGGNFRFIHVGGNYISAFHTNFFYVNNRFTELPEVRIDSEIADTITNGIAEQFQFSKTDNHYFFLAQDIIFMFTPGEGKTPNVKSVHERLGLPGKEFAFSKEDLIDFCNMANVVSETALANCVMTPNGNILNLNLKDKNYNRGVDKNVMLSGELDKFSFDSRLMLTPFRVIPVDALKCKTNQNCLIITNDKEYFCFMGLQN